MISLRARAILAVAAAAAALSCHAAPVRDEVGVARFANPFDPPSFRALDARERARFDLGHAVFNTQWVPAGTPRAERIDGLGPLFNADSCDECHNEGARGGGPAGNGPAPVSLVVKLDSRRARERGEHATDPTYGHVLNTEAVDGLEPEGEVLIHYEPVRGRYPDGQPFSLRAPHYRLTHLRYGPLAPDTVIAPRIAPAIFGDGLLEAVVGRPAARFDWEGAAVSIRDQTTQAFAREMGLTNSVLDHDDCTPRERDCLARPNGGNPEVSPELLDAVVFFESMLAVPESPRQPPAGNEGAVLFASVGCAGCHTPHLTAEIRDAAGVRRPVRIAPYTDLLLHDLGDGLADRDVTGRPVPSRWRTAPLWGLEYRLVPKRRLTFLHDGRARSIEEAILWHGGEAAPARSRFERLPRRDREALLAWLGTL